MFSPETYKNRRYSLKHKFDSGLLLFIGNELCPVNYRDNIYPFRQDSTFLYYFGLNRPALCAILDIEHDREIIFGDEPSIDHIIWTGNVPGLKEEAALAALSDIKPLEELPKFMKNAVELGRTIHYLPPYRELHTRKLSHLTGTSPEAVERSYSLPLIQAVIAQRQIKSEEELAEIGRAVDLSVDMHVNAMRMAKPGMTEAQVAAEVYRTALAAGGDLAFPIIATINGQVLHNYYYGNILREGNIFLLDAGAQTPMGYAGDLSSSFPVSKRFAPEQKEIYQITLDAHKAAVQELKPGIKFIEVHLAACKTLIEGLKQIGMMKGDTEEALAKGAHALFFPCGVGHMMGLDVHDMESLGEEHVGYEHEARSAQFGLRSLRLAKELKPGFVHTIEPGIYFIPELIDLWKAGKTHQAFLNYSLIDKFRHFGGIRNEENFVITTNGHRQLGRPFPKTVAAIEAMR